MKRVEKRKPGNQGAFHAHGSRFMKTAYREGTNSGNSSKKSVTKAACILSNETWGKMESQQKRMWNEAAANNIKRQTDRNVQSAQRAASAKETKTMRT